MNPAPSCRAHSDPVDVRALGTIAYLEAWELQRALVQARASESGPDCLLLLEHPSVYTAGKRTSETDRPIDGTPVIDVDRGGTGEGHGRTQHRGDRQSACRRGPHFRRATR